MSQGGRIIGQQINEYCNGDGHGTISCLTMSYGAYLIYGVIFIVFLWKVIFKKDKSQLNKISKSESKENFLEGYWSWVKKKGNLKFSLFLPLLFGLLFFFGQIWLFFVVSFGFSLLFYSLKKEPKE